MFAVETVIGVRQISKAMTDIHRAATNMSALCQDMTVFQVPFRRLVCDPTRLRRIVTCHPLAASRPRRLAMTVSQMQFRRHVWETVRQRAVTAITAPYRQLACGPCLHLRVPIRHEQCRRHRQELELNCSRLRILLDRGSKKLQF